MHVGYGRIILALLAASCASHADEPARKPQQSAPVVFAGRNLFSIQASVGSFSPADRARVIQERLKKISTDPTVPIDSIKTSEGEAATDIIAGDRVLMSVTDADGAASGRPRQELAREYAQSLQGALNDSRHETHWKSVVWDSLIALLATVALVGLVILLHRVSIAAQNVLRRWQGTRIRTIRIQRVDLLTAERMTEALVGLAGIIRLAVTLLAIYFYVLFALSFIPWTRSWSAALFGYVRDTLALIVGSVVDYVPNLFIIIVVAAIIRYCLKLAGLIFREVGKGNISVPGFYREWAGPTYKIVRFLLLVFGAIVIFPYIPGSRSPGFQGISIFLGLLLSLGSAGAVSNIIAGVLLTYTRAFEVGDRVRIAETTGDVLEKTLLATRVRTIKNEDITVPNSLVLGSHIINFSACARNGGLILHTSVTIGYDAPWRQVHDLLIAAAVSTTNILKQPAPFVLQTSLNDFYVTYEINAYTSRPNEMAVTYAELHQNIQDKFNEAQVEICSPHFAAVRDANRIAIPGEYVAGDYVPPSFRVAQTGNGAVHAPHSASSPAG